MRKMTLALMFAAGCSGASGLPSSQMEGVGQGCSWVGGPPSVQCFYARGNVYLPETGMDYNGVTVSVEAESSVGWMAWIGFSFDENAQGAYSPRGSVRVDYARNPQVGNPIDGVQTRLPFGSCDAGDWRGSVYIDRTKGWNIQYSLMCQTDPAVVLDGTVAGPQDTYADVPPSTL